MVGSNIEHYLHLLMLKLPSLIFYLQPLKNFRLVSSSPLFLCNCASLSIHLWDNLLFLRERRTNCCMLGAGRDRLPGQLVWLHWRNSCRLDLQCRVNSQVLLDRLSHIQVRPLATCSFRWLLSFGESYWLQFLEWRCNFRYQYLLRRDSICLW